MCKNSNAAANINRRRDDAQFEKYLDSLSEDERSDRMKNAIEPANRLGLVNEIDSKLKDDTIFEFVEGSNGHIYNNLLLAFV